jgi:hypothetical protein
LRASTRIGKSGSASFHSARKSCRPTGSPKGVSAHQGECLVGLRAGDVTAPQCGVGVRLAGGHRSGYGRKLMPHGHTGGSLAKFPSRAPLTQVARIGSLRSEECILFRPAGSPLDLPLRGRQVALDVGQL